MNSKNRIYISIISLAILLITSCATSINVRVLRPAELDLNGAKTISVLPIKPYEYYDLRELSRGEDILIGVFFQIFDRVGPDEKRCIDKLQYEIESGLMDSPYIDLVSSSAVSAALKRGTSNPSDVYLTGEVVNFDIYDERIERRVKVKDGDGDRKAEYDYVHEYCRNVKMYVRYQIVDSASGKIISYNKVEMRNSSGYYSHSRDLPSAYSLLEYDLKRAARKILQELQPYSVTKSITLLKDKTKNPDFKYADKLAKDGYVKESYEAFTNLYKATEMMEAGYNAAILLEAMGNLTEAEELMMKLYKKFPVQEVKAGLYDIQNEIKQAKKLKTQTETSDVLDVDF